jgi:hypothetical protein
MSVLDDGKITYWFDRLKNSFAYILVYAVFITLAFGTFKLYQWFFPKKSVPMVTTTTMGSGSTSYVYNAPQQVRLTQGVYTRGSTDFDGVRGEVGVFKELTTHFEVEVGGGVDRRDKENNGFASVGGRVKF